MRTCPNGPAGLKIAIGQTDASSEQGAGLVSVEQTGLSMASGRNFRRRQRAGEDSLAGAERLDLGSEHPADGLFKELRELLANSDHDGVRLEKLARAQQLVADPHYPPTEVLESVAKLLAKHLRPGDEA
jgi:hypothetical protein